MADRARHAKKIDTVHWTGAAGQFVGQAAGTAAGNLFPAQHLPETLLRIRGEWAVNLANVATPGTAAQITAGVIQVPEGSSTTVTWSPFTDADAPWIWWDSITLLYAEQVADVIASFMTSSGRRVVDSKAMRKLRNTELQLVIENTTVPGLTAASVNMNFNARVLSGS